MPNSQSSPSYEPAVLCGLAVIAASSILLLSLTWVAAAAGVLV